MNNGSQGLSLRDLTASGINKEDDLYKVMYSDDDGNGAAARELDEAKVFIDYYTRTDDVRNHRGITLNSIIELFTGLRRRVSEKDSVYLRRFLSITERKKDEVWGTKWNIKHVFEAHFLGINVYVCENTDDIDRNLLENGDFEDDEHGENTGWELGGDARLTGAARFSGRLGIKTVFVANRPIPIQPLDGPVMDTALMELCPAGEGAADDRIVELARPGDLALTRDLPLAERLVEAGVTVLDDRGRVSTKENIRERRSLRDFTVGLAENGLEYERTASYGKKELNAFANSLDRELTRLTRTGSAQPAPAEGSAQPASG